MMEEFQKKLLNSNLKITFEARVFLAKPAGILLPGTIEENTINAIKWFKEKIQEENKKPSVICVGDVVTEAFLNNNELAEYLKMSFVDGKTKRKEYDIQGGSVLPKKVTLDNPPGYIMADASAQIKKELQTDERCLFWVKGEEDLLVIPLVLFAEKGTFIVYGQPPITDAQMKIPAGMVIIQVDDKIKHELCKILEKFEDSS